MGFRAMKLLFEGFGGVKPCNHQYRGCHLKNPTDISGHGCPKKREKPTEFEFLGLWRDHEVLRVLEARPKPLKNRCF